jgi:ABC-type Fe3+/spermidine/putrescine transport system ATPase subunit
MDDELAHLDMDAGFKSCVRINGDISLGEDVMVSIRPERVILTTSAPEQVENVFPGVVDFVSYLGSFVVFLVHLDHGSTLIRASEPIPDGTARFAEGDKVFAHWKAEHAIYLKR